MKTSIVVVLIIITLSACGQIGSETKKVLKPKPYSTEVISLYQQITQEICDCTFKNMKDNKPSSALYSCQKNIVDKYADTLKTIGYDPETPEGKNRLLNGINLYSGCYEIQKLLEKEWADNDANRLLFKGTLVSQIKLKNGSYKIAMQEINSAKTKTFFSKIPIDETLIKKSESYELIVEYEIVRNKKTKKDEFHLKGTGEVSGVGIGKIENQ